MSQSKTIFGGDKGWDARDWTASDDRVRGGKSQNSKSYLDIKGSTACFHGNLDIKTLGGAGFASQRTVGDERSWDLSAYDGIHLNVGKDDGKRYTFILKDEILPPMADGREQSTVSYEYDFSAAGNYSVFIPWSELKPTYRGKEKSDAPPLNTKGIKRWSFMMRSFFGGQEGDFSVEINSVKAVMRSDDLEAGLTDEKSDNDDIGKKPWSWKTSRIVGLAVIFTTTWAVCTGICWYKGLDISMMTPRNWWRMARYDRLP
ncbi:complex I intermediate-associated protein 30 [Stagonosporopsis vannaccii]|nr:complex I intermediate-associated protein 30 [Stagonosporopsis vannaccii]